MLLLARKQRAFVSRSLHQGRSFQYVRRVRGAKFADATMVPRRSSCRHGTNVPFVAATDGRRLRDRNATTVGRKLPRRGMLLTEGETPVVTRIASATARLALGAALMSVTVLGQVAAHAQASGPGIVSLTLNGVVDPFTADYITSNVARAQADGDEAVLLTIDTPGGLGSSMDEITQSFLTSTIPVIAYVAPSGARAATGADRRMKAPADAARAPLGAT